MRRAGALASGAGAFLLATAAGAQAENACTGPAYDLASRFVGASQEFSVTTEGERLETLFAHATHEEVVGAADKREFFRRRHGVDDLAGNARRLHEKNAAAARRRIYLVILSEAKNPAGDVNHLADRDLQMDSSLRSE